MTPDQIAEIRARADASYTERPWGDLMLMTDHRQAVADVRALLDEVARLRAAALLAIGEAWAAGHESDERLTPDDYLQEALLGVGGGGA